MVVLVFGGAFITDTNTQSVVWARAIASLFGASSPALLPPGTGTHKFPTAPNDIWDAVRWIAANSSALDADLTKGFVIGDRSAGGNLSIVAALAR